MGTYPGRAPTIGSSIVRSFVVVVGMLGGVVLQTGQAQAAPSVWSVTPSPNQDSTTNYLIDVSCSDPTWCVTVGESFDLNVTPSQTLIESWNGTAWSITPSPDVGDGSSLDDYNTLSGVSCTSSTDCVAVGDYNDPDLNYTQTLIETWDGTAWSITPSPNLGSSYNTLDGVSCTSSADCVAVGYYVSGGSTPNRTLVETWDGSVWSTTPSPNLTGDNMLNGVSCTSATNCVAVGMHNRKHGGFRTLIETWNGAAWSITPSPVFRHADHALYGVSCTSSTDCVAVGDNLDSTLVESWNGAAWSITPSPKKNGRGDSLLGVSCTSSTDCVAVGYYGIPTIREKTLVESWDGSAWSIVASPNPGSPDVPYAVSCTSSTDCVAVGYDGSSATTYQTMVLTGSG